MEEWQKKGIYVAISMATIIIILLIGVSIAAPFLVEESCTIEAGRELTVDKVVKNPVVKVVSSVQVQPVTGQLGKQETVVRVGVQRVTTEVTIRDRIAPKVTLREVSVLKGNECKIDSFVVKIEDATDTQLEYVRPPDFSLEGIQKVKIKVTDKAGNMTVAETKLVVVGT